jgi:hypothetical protein
METRSELHNSRGLCPPAEGAQQIVTAGSVVGWSSKTAHSPIAIGLRGRYLKSVDTFTFFVWFG